MGALLASVMILLLLLQRVSSCERCYSIPSFIHKNESCGASRAQGEQTCALVIVVVPTTDDACCVSLFFVGKSVSCVIRHSVATEKITVLLFDIL